MKRKPKHNNRKTKKTKIKARVGTSPAEQLSADVPAKHRTWFDDVLDEREELHGCILLEPRDQLDEAIVGWDMEGNHVIYSYEKLIAAYHDAFDDIEDDEDRITTAHEWVDYNIVRGVAYMGDRKPVIICSGER